jgi:hypothetical protein
LSDITGSGSPALAIDKTDAEQYYSVGAPYLAHTRDFVRLADSWAGVLPATNAAHTQADAVDYAFNTAAAHLWLQPTGVTMHTFCVI